MNLTIALEQRFQMTPDNTVWTPTSFAHAFWSRYLAVFDAVRVLARVQSVVSVPADFRPAGGDGVTFVPLPYYIGPAQYVRQARALRRAVATALEAPGAVILRVPSQIAAHVEAALSAGHPYGVEVVGDPHDVFAPGAVRHSLRPFFRWWFARSLRRQCAGACAAAYVTAHTLQQRYPPRAGAFSTHYSSIELGDDAFVAAPRAFQQPPVPVRLLMVGSLEQMYKAPDVLLHALVRCVAQGLNAELTVVGQGRHQPEMAALADSLGLAGRVRFVGQLPAGAAVRAQLDQADVFVLPSRTEGLPRAMIEAMARGLPCIGSTAGGIPELLPPEDMVPPNDAGALAQKIQDVVCSPARMTAMSARNLQVARSYHESLLRARRIEFYTYVKDQTQAWLDRR